MCMPFMIALAPGSAASLARAAAEAASSADSSSTGEITAVAAVGISCAADAASSAIGCAVIDSVAIGCVGSAAIVAASAVGVSATSCTRADAASIVGISPEAAPSPKASSSPAPLASAEALFGSCRLSAVVSSFGAFFSIAAFPAPSARTFASSALVSFHASSSHVYVPATFSAVSQCSSRKARISSICCASAPRRYRTLSGAFLRAARTFSNHLTVGGAAMKM